MERETLIRLTKNKEKVASEIDPSEKIEKETTSILHGPEMVKGGLPPEIRFDAQLDAYLALYIFLDESLAKVVQGLKKQGVWEEYKKSVKNPRVAGTAEPDKGEGDNDSKIIQP